MSIDTPDEDIVEPIPELVRLNRPRALSVRERAMIAFLVEHPFGDDALRAQLQSAEVIGSCSCGCPSVLLGVDATSPRSTSTDRRPGSAGDLTAYQLTSRGLGAQVTLHVANGAMYELEIWGHGYGFRPRVNPTRLKRIQEID